MRLLLDEDVPIQLLEPIRHLLRGHVVDHVDQLGWKGKKDRFLLPDARRKGYDALVTNDSAQLDSAEESKAIRDSGLHHIRYRQDTRRGLDGLALAIGSVVATIRQVVAELEQSDGQRLVEIPSIQPGKRHKSIDPRVEPPKYWPSRAGQPHKPAKTRPPRSSTI
ncbi:MAG TPA: hypothetical protein VG317_18490 [Pseudonocardiaceae bacterium]|jgi:hypothetical protein|nr:hypothetical protein [Pseudonocardiaceae bacterium]